MGRMVIEYDVFNPHKTDLPLMVDFFQSDKQSIAITYESHIECKKRVNAFRRKFNPLGIYFTSKILDTTLYISKEI